MKTDDMISLLASNVARIDRVGPSRRYRRALLLGGLGSILLMAMMLGIRPDMPTLLITPLFWAKLAFSGGIAAAALHMATRLSRPGMAVGRGWQWVTALIVLVWLAAIAVLISAPASERLPLLLGATWQTCAFNISVLSMPAFIGAIWAMKGLAPTRLRTAGAAAGLLAGSFGAVVYCLHCPEMAVPFWAVWYLAGMMIPVVLGALLGPKLLRW